MTRKQFARDLKEIATAIMSKSVKDVILALADRYSGKNPSAIFTIDEQRYKEEKKQNSV